MGDQGGASGLTEPIAGSPPSGAYHVPGKIFGISRAKLFGALLALAVLATIIAVSLRTLDVDEPEFPPLQSTFDEPTSIPTRSPLKDGETHVPTNIPSRSPLREGATHAPTNIPTRGPTRAPVPTFPPGGSFRPTESPTTSPPTPPTEKPTDSPTKLPTKNPTKQPTTGQPTKNPTKQPTSPTDTPPEPTPEPTLWPNPTESPTDSPSININVWNWPTESPTLRPCILRTQPFEGWLVVKQCTDDSSDNACYLLNNFEKAFPDGLVIGDNTTGRYISYGSVDGPELMTLFSTPTNVGDTKKLPDCGGSSCDPSSMNNMLLIEVIATALNIGFDRCSREGLCDSFCSECNSGTEGLADAVMLRTDCGGMTAQQVLDDANCMLGGSCTPRTYGKMYTCVEHLNWNYLDGTQDNGEMECPESLLRNRAYGRSSDDETSSEVVGPAVGAAAAGLLVSMGAALFVYRKKRSSVTLQNEASEDQIQAFT